MGNTVVIKPSENTPLSVLALVEIFRRHLPADVVTAISGDREVGAALASHPDIAKIVFTGSTATGRRIVESSSANLARLTLELGGNDAGIVLPGTDVDAIADTLFWGAFMNTGQVCAALKRLYVHDSIYAETVAALAARAEAAPMGSGHDKANRLGPVQNPAQFDIVARLVRDAEERGARIVTGGEPAAELGPLFYRPTIIADVDDDAAVVVEEQFGPVLPVIRYTDVDDAVRRANGTEQGLGASVWGPDPDAAALIAQRLDAGDRVDQPARRRRPAGALRRHEGVGLRPGVRRRRAEGDGGDQGHPALRTRWGGADRCSARSAPPSVRAARGDQTAAATRVTRAPRSSSHSSSAVAASARSPRQTTCWS